MADADPHPLVAGADMGGDRAQAIMPGVAAADLHPELAGREVELVVDDDDRAEIELREAQSFADCARLVHVGLRLDERHPLIANQSVRGQALKSRAKGAEAAPPAIASTAMKPMLWRLRACHAPGLPSPAMTSMGSSIDQPAPPRRRRCGAGMGGQAARDARRPLLLGGRLGCCCGLGGGAAAPFAGAAAPFAPAAAAAPAAGAAAAPAAGAAVARGAGVSST